MKLAAIVVTVLLAAVVALWLVFVRAPVSHEVCQRKIDLVLAGAAGHPEAAASLVDHIRLTCPAQADILLQFRGKPAYARYARCVMAAETFEDAERCG